MPIGRNGRAIAPSVLTATLALALVLVFPGATRAQCCTCCEGYTCCEPDTSQTWTYLGEPCDYYYDYWYQFEGCGLMHAGGTWVYGAATSAYRDCQCNQHRAGHPVPPSCPDPPGQPRHDTQGWSYRQTPEQLGGGHAWRLSWKIHNPNLSYEEACQPSAPCYGKDGEVERLTHTIWYWKIDVGCPCQEY